MKKNTIVLIILLLVALVGGVLLVQTNQETRRGAAFANTILSLLPSEKIQKKIGESVPVQLWYQTESGAKVDGVQTQVCYDNHLTLPVEGAVSVNTGAGFDSEAITAEKEIGGRKCVVVVVTSKKAASSLKTADRAFTLNFTASKIGEGQVLIMKDSSRVTGDNPNDAVDKAITITSVVGTSYIISDTIETIDPPITGMGSSPKLKFRMSIYGVNDTAECAGVDKMPLKVTLLAKNGTSKVYENVMATKVGMVNSRAVYEVSLNLSGFNYKDDLAVFVKTPKTLQSKFGINNQTEFYRKPGGEISGLTTDLTTTPVFNFENYPLLVGDVTGEGGVQDGQVNGLDFSFVKAEAIKRTEVASGGYILTDLNCNCKMESQDLANLMLSLSVKQEQLY